MKRILSMVLATSIAAAPLSACANSDAPKAAASAAPPGSLEPREWPEHQRQVTAPELPSAETDSQREIACWGDSMTKGVGADVASIFVSSGEEFDISYLSYPDVLERLTGMTTYNYGVSGATSDEIAYMQGGAQLEYDADYFTAVDEDVMEQGREHPGDILVLEIGSNGGWNEDYSELIEQYRSMIDHAGCEDYIIIGDTDDPGTSVADSSQEAFPDGTGTGETAWETALREEFGDHFINMRAFLVERGLDVAGLEATDDDREAAERGCVSEQLRSDWTHLNSLGYYAQAVAVYERGRDLGYWS